ncbi:nodulation receptor kinase [Selaginella moellendorffii]|nr:nodulation receptor kinase [Selaginella moellendorffii]|eukprot:XP_002979562.2 nodulation receptor kinase [Selaginella moellendorffii]
MAISVYENLTVIFLLFVRLTLCAANSQGAVNASFISLACGSDNAFLDSHNLTWIPDDAYADGFGRPVFVPGDKANLGPANGFDHKLYDHLRYFDDTKSCYKLPVTPGTIYLIRGTFFYGNYDTKGSPPSFSISLDATLIHKVTFTDDVKHAEAIFTADAQEVSYCLIALSASMKPVISSLELRPLVNFFLPDGILETIARLDVANWDKNIRYPVDPSDLIWSTDISRSDKFVNGSVGSDFYDHVPKIVMDTAATSDNALQYVFHVESSDLDFYVCLHFLELEPLLRPGDRIFDVLANHQMIRRNLDIQEISGLAGYKLCFEVLASPTLNISLIANDTSRRGPMLNALEAYHIVKKAAGTLKRDVGALLPLKGMYRSKLQWSGDPCLPLQTNWDGINCDMRSGGPAIVEVNLEGKGLNGSVPTSLSRLEDLEILQLDENMFTGEIPDFSSLKNLTTLGLENNNLNGTIPEYLGHMPKLAVLHLDNNDLGGYIPSDLRKMVNFTFSGNQLLLGWGEDAKGHSLTKFFIAGFAGGFAILLVVMAGCLFFAIRKRKMKLVDIVAFSANSQLKATPQYVTTIAKDAKESNHIRRLSLKEVVNATNCYKTVIGEGGFGTVFYGTLSGQAVAVKARSSSSIQGTREFNTELNLLSRIQHENLVPLLGFCAEDEQEILIYPYMPNGSLQDRLYGEGFKRKPLDWPTRLSIALGAAKGLSFLHAGGDLSIIHRDIKSSNILLDQSMTAKVADFGFSKFAPQDGDSVVSLEVRGTAGYLDPEYYLTQELTVKSDVYSFGVVLLEVICGREPLSIDRPRSEWSLVEWARPYIQDTNIEAIVDSSISSSYSPEAMWRVLEVAMLSVQPHSSRRPSMSDIVRELEDALIIENNASQFMASIDSNPSGLSKQFDISPAFSETMGSPDPR